MITGAVSRLLLRPLQRFGRLEDQSLFILKPTELGFNETGVPDIFRTSAKFLAPLFNHLAGRPSTSLNPRRSPMSPEAGRELER